MDTLREKYGFTKAKKAQTDNWCNFPTDYSGVYYTAVFNSQKQISVAVVIERTHPDWNLRVLKDLEEYKDEIETELGTALEWQPRENRKSCQIVLSRPGSIDDDTALAEIQDRIVENLLKFKRIFGPKLAELIG